MTIDVERALAESRCRHKRDTGLKIALPILVGLLILILLTALVTIMRSSAQVSVSANFLVTLLLLCPLALCTLPFSVGLMTLAIISGRIHPRAKKPLRRVESWSHQMRNHVTGYSDRVARWSIGVNARVAPFVQWTDRVLGIEGIRRVDEGDHDDKS
jgi:uncharacterized integral membrane protein